MIAFCFYSCFIHCLIQGCIDFNTTSCPQYVLKNIILYYILNIKYITSCQNQIINHFNVWDLQKKHFKLWRITNSKSVHSYWITLISSYLGYLQWHDSSLPLLSSTTHTFSFCNEYVSQNSRQISKWVANVRRELGFITDTLRSQKNLLHIRVWGSL